MTASSPQGCFIREASSEDIAGQFVCIGIHVHFGMICSGGFAFSM